MVASAKKFLVDVDLAHNVLSKARLMTSAFSGANVGEIRYDDSNEQISWWTSLGTERKITDIPLNSFNALNQGDISLNNYKIINLGTPTNPNDATTKSYVDGIAQGLNIKDSVKALSSLNVSSLSGTTTVDGVSLSVDDRVLLIAQSTASENGIWLVKSSSWVRPSDFATGSDASSDFVFVQQGTSYSDTGWVCTNNSLSAVVDTDNLVFTQFSGAGSIIAGDGLTQTGNTIEVGAGTGIIVNTNDIAIDTSLIPRKYSLSMGDNSATDFVITHSFNTRDIIAQVWETSGSYERVYPDIELTSLNTLTVKFTLAPTTNQYRIVILG